MERTRKLVIAEALYFDMEDLKQSECVKIVFKNKERERDRDRDRQRHTERESYTRFVSFVITLCVFYVRVDPVISLNWMNKVFCIHYIAS